MLKKPIKFELRIGGGSRIACVWNRRGDNGNEQAPRQAARRRIASAFCSFVSFIINKLLDY